MTRRTTNPAPTSGSRNGKFTRQLAGDQAKSGKIRRTAQIREQPGSLILLACRQTGNVKNGRGKRHHPDRVLQHCMQVTELAERAMFLGKDFGRRFGRINDCPDSGCRTNLRESPRTGACRMHHRRQQGLHQQCAHCQPCLES